MSEGSGTVSCFLVIHDAHPMALNLLQALARAGAACDAVDWLSSRDSGGRARLRDAVSAEVVILAGASLPAGVGSERAASTLPWLEDRTAKPLLALGRISGRLATALGASEAPSLRPSHGHITQIYHAGVGLLAGLPKPLLVMRYDSVLPRSLPPHLAAVAWSEEGDILAWRHRHRPWWGISFHPESLFAGPSRELLTHLVERGREAFYAAT